MTCESSCREAGAATRLPHDHGRRHCAQNHVRRHWLSAAAPTFPARAGEAEAEAGVVEEEGNRRSPALPYRRGKPALAAVAEEGAAAAARRFDRPTPTAARQASLSALQQRICGTSCCPPKQIRLGH